MVVQAQTEIGEGLANPTDPDHTPTIIQPSTSQPQKKQRPRKPKRKDIEIPQSSGPTDNVADEAVNEEMDDSLERATATATSLDAEQDREDASKQGMIANIDANKDIYLVNVHTDEDMFDVNDLDSDEVIVDNASTIPVSAATTTTTTTATITNVEVTLAQALAELKSAKPKAVKVVIQEPEQGTTTTTPTTIIFVPKPLQEKGKGIMIKEPVVEQAKIKADYQLAQRPQAQEQEELTDEEKARLFIQFLKQRRKHFAAKRAEEKRNKPPTSIMCTYLKNIEGWKPKNLKNKSFTNIQELFDKAMKRSSSKRAGDELEQENAKKQKVDEDKETSELQSLIKVVFVDEEEVAIDVVPLATKPPTIVDWKIHKEGNKSYYQIIRADGKSQMYRVFSQMVKSFTREDLEDLYKLVKAKYGSTRPVEDLDLILWGDLKTMFEPHVEDTVWRNQQNYSVLDWKLYDSCGVHSLRKQNVYIHILGRIVRIKRLLDDLRVTAVKKWDPTRSILQLGQQFGIDIPVRVSHAHCADIVMSDLEDSTITYTEVSSPFEELLDIGSPGVVVYGYDGLLMHPPSPDYVPGLEELAEEQPLPAALSPTADSPGYIVDSDTKEDPKEDPADYPANEGDNDDDDVEENEDKEEEEHPALTDLLGIIFEFIRQNKNETRRT
ncbi:hypothetical protein Tco_0003285 [Tanacetum coccineum]